MCVVNDQISEEIRKNLYIIIYVVYICILFLTIEIQVKMKNKGTLLLLQFFHSQRVYMCLLLVIHVRESEGVAFTIPGC